MSEITILGSISIAHEVVGTFTTFSRTLPPSICVAVLSTLVSCVAYFRAIIMGVISLIDVDVDVHSLVGSTFSVLVGGIFDPGEYSTLSDHMHAAIELGCIMAIPSLSVSDSPNNLITLMLRSFLLFELTS